MTRQLVIAVMMAGLGAAAQAQAKPDFSGAWAPVMPKTNSPAAAGGVVGLPPSDLTIQHTRTEVAISRTAFDQVITQTFKLDGGESTNKSGAVVRISRTRWDGPRLIVEGKASQVTSAGYSAWTFKDTYSIDTRGRLTIQGEQMDSDGKVSTRSMEYTRKPSK